MDIFGGLLILYLIYFCAVYFFVDILKIVFTICLWLFKKIMDGADWLRPRFAKGMKWIWFWSIRRIKALFSRKNSRPEEEAPPYKEKETQRKDEEQTRKEDAENRHREEETRKKREEANRQQQQQQQQRQHRQNTTDDYTEALILLGLQEDFTQKNFKKAYRRAIMSAHPDRGGTKEKAQALNKARDVINKRKGWKNAI